jgi:hypothetical protein
LFDVEDEGADDVAVGMGMMGFIGRASVHMTMAGTSDEGQSRK